MQVSLGLALTAISASAGIPIGTLKNTLRIALTTGGTISVSRLLSAAPLLGLTTGAVLSAVGTLVGAPSISLTTAGILSHGALFDIYPALIGYSLRKLSSSATSSLRVRRSSDNAEQDIGFTGDSLDTAALESFCGVGDGFVVKMYNQGTGSGAAYDAVQATAGNQPQIVASGTTITDNGLPAIDLSGVADKFLRTGVITTINTPCTYFSVARAATIDGNNQILFGGTGVDNRHMFYIRTTTNWSIFGGTTVAEDGAADTDQHHATTLISSGAASNCWIDGTQIITNQDVGSDPIVGYTLGSFYSAPSATDGWRGKVQEFIAYDSNQTSNRTSIEADINDHWGVV